MKNKKQKHQYSNIDASESPEHWVKLMSDFAELSDIKFMRELVLGWIKDSKLSHVLDVGCGTGDNIRQLANAMPKSTELVGIDFSQAMIDYASTQDNPANVSFQTGDVTQLNFADESFDLIRIERVLHHVENLHVAFNELYRILKPGKFLAISEPDVSMLRLFPLELDLNLELAKRLTNTMANADLGYYMRQKALEHNFIVKEHKIIHLIWDDLDAIDSATHFIDTLRDVLAEHKKSSLMDDVSKAGKEGSFYFAIPIHNVLLAKS